MTGPVGRDLDHAVQAPVLPQRPARQTVPVFLGAVIAGPVFGEGLAALVAPDSFPAQAIGFMTLPLVLGLGYRIWTARVAATAMRHFMPRLVRALRTAFIHRTRPEPAELLPDAHQVDEIVATAVRAASSFTRVGWTLGAFAGLLAGIAAPGGRFGSALVSFWLAAGLYGHGLTRLARAGFLPLPEDD